MKKTRKASAEARKQQTVQNFASSEATFQKFLMEGQVYNGKKLGAGLETLVEEGDISTEYFQELVEKLEKQKQNYENLKQNLKTEHKPKEKLGSKLGNVKLYEENLDEVPENLMAIYQNQLYDLANPEVTLEHLASEVTFYDFLMRIARGEPVNIHYIPYRNIENLVKILKNYFTVEENPDTEQEKQKPMRKSRVFKQVLGSENTPNHRNYEENLIQNLTFKRMVEEMELLDGVKLKELKENLDSIEYLADQYREFIVENGLSCKEQKEKIKEYQKARKKITDRNLKIKYDLSKKYGYLC